MSAEQDIESGITFLKSVLDKLMRPARVLLVEDEEADILAAERVFAKFRCELTVCRDGEAALGMLDAGVFDLVFLDLKLPKLSGNSVLAKVAGIKPDTKFVVVTGCLEALQIPETMKESALVAFEKPIRASVLKLFLSPR